MTQAKDRLLKTALAANLVLATTSGLIATLAAPAVASVTGIGLPWLIAALGVGLLTFALGIGWTLLRLRLGLVLLISVLDIFWALGTMPLTLIPGLLTPEGTVLVLILAMAVGLLAAAQLAGIRAILSAGAPEGQYRHCIRLKSDADPERLWRVIRDLGNIARYSSGLSASRLEKGHEAALGSVRICTNHAGQSWAEEVETLDDAARTVFFRFRSEAADFPFPLAALSGGWTVTPASNGGADVDIWWIVTPKQRRLGWLVVALMSVALDRDVPGLVGAMAAEAMGEAAWERHRRPALAYC